jgi:hypothetical protein
MAQTPDPGAAPEFGESGWRSAIRRSMQELVRDRCSMTAGSLAYLRPLRRVMRTHVKGPHAWVAATGT